MRKSPPRRQPVWGTHLDPNMQGMEKRRVFLPFKIRKLLLRQQLLSHVKISLGTSLEVVVRGFLGFRRTTTFKPRPAKAQLLFSAYGFHHQQLPTLLRGTLIVVL